VPPDLDDAHFQLPVMPADPPVSPLPLHHCLDEGGNLMLHDFFVKSTDAIFECGSLEDVDAHSIVNKDPKTCLVATENEKKQQ